MKLRIANKILKASETESKLHHSDEQLQAAINRYEKTLTHKEANEFWDYMMTKLGVEGRAEVLAGSGAPGMAFNLLMREGYK